MKQRKKPQINNANIFEIAEQLRDKLDQIDMHHVKAYLEIDKGALKRYERRLSQLSNIAQQHIQRATIMQMVSLQLIELHSEDAVRCIRVMMHRDDEWYKKMETKPLAFIIDDLRCV
jgi:hypothetical protein